MPIKVKTRKILWSKAGNRCAICKCQLVEKLENHKLDFIVGEECHIISSKIKGPRGQVVLSSNDYDIYDNLILLCANHHKLIDEFPETFTFEILKILKNTHEQWIKEAIDKDIEEYNRAVNNIEHLDRIQTKSQINYILQNAHAHFTEFGSISDQNLTIEIGEFFDELNEFSDFYADISLSDKTKYLIKYEESINIFKEKGITIFGKALIRKYEFLKLPESEYKISMLVAVDSNNNNFIKDDKLIIKLPENFVPTF